MSRMKKKPVKPPGEAKKKESKGIPYQNSKGTFFLRNGKLYDDEGNRTSSLAVATNREPLIKA